MFSEKELLLYTIILPDIFLFPECKISMHFLPAVKISFMISIFFGFIVFSRSQEPNLSGCSIFIHHVPSPPSCRRSLDRLTCSSLSASFDSNRLFKLLKFYNVTLRRSDRFCDFCCSQETSQSLSFTTEYRMARLIRADKRTDIFAQSDSATCFWQNRLRFPVIFIFIELKKTGILKL